MFAVFNNLSRYAWKMHFNWILDSLVTSECEIEEDCVWVNRNENTVKLIM